MSRDIGGFLTDYPENYGTSEIEKNFKSRFHTAWKRDFSQQFGWYYAGKMGRFDAGVQWEMIYGKDKIARGMEVGKGL